MNKRLLMGLFFALSLFFTSCASDADDRNMDGMGRLTVRLTDAPFPYSEVAEANVTVYKVELRRASDDGSDSEEGGSPFITLMDMDEEKQVNLLTLTGGVTEELADLEVPAGTYDEVRVYVKGVNLVLTNEDTFDFKVPSGEQTGIKVKIEPGLTVVGGLSSDLVLDFDVSQSFVARGNIGKPDFNGFIFKPVIIASNTSIAGTLYGKVTELINGDPDGLEDAQVSVIAADTVYKTTPSKVDGMYSIDGILAGSYKAVAEKEGFLSSDTVDIEIVAANKTVQDFLLEAEAEENPGDTTDGN